MSEPPLPSPPPTAAGDGSTLSAPPATAPLPAPPTAPSTPQTRGLGAIFVRGMIWGTVALFISKFSSFIATIFLGWIFGSADYGAYAAAVSAAMIGDVLTDGGLRRVLITRGAEYARIGRTAFYIALAANCLGCFLMLRAAPLYREDHPEAVGQLVVLAIALVLSTLGTIQRSKLSIDMRFGQVAFMGTVSSLLRNTFTVVFAWLFAIVYKSPALAPLAFVLPILLVNLWEAAYVYWKVGRVPNAPFDDKLALELIGQGKWVIFAMMGGALIYRGDYLVASNMLTPTQVVDAVTGAITKIDITGQYYFAFQLTVALFSPFSIGMAAVIQPVMARLRDEPERQASAFVRMVRTSVFIATPASLASIFITPLMVHLLWRGKWDMVVPVVQIVAATECIRQMHHMCLATIDSRGEWKKSAAVIIVDGVLTVTAAIIGCLVGTLLALTIAVAVERTLLAVAQAIYTYRLTGGRARTILVQIFPPVMIALPIGLLVGGGVALGTTNDNLERWLLALLALPAVLAYAAAARVLTPLRFNEAADLVLSRIRKRRAAPAAA